MEKYQQMIATMLIATQIGCASKVAKITAPLDTVEFSENYRYKIQKKNGDVIENISGSSIQATQEKVSLSDQPNTHVNADEIESIEGKGLQRKGSYAGTGFGVGAVTGLFTSLFLIAAASDGSSSGSSEQQAEQAVELGAVLVVSPLVMLGFGGIGAIIGAFIPKYPKVQITPVIGPVENGVQAGANLGVRF